MNQKRARKGLAQPQAWHVGDVSASPEQGEACELTGVTRAASQAFERTRAYGEIIPSMTVAVHAVMTVSFVQRINDGSRLVSRGLRALSRCSLHIGCNASFQLRTHPCGVLRYVCVCVCVCVFVRV